ncbi:MAG TPA: hypothetical protein VGO00_29385 [Kofleriaceae bacterium]|nr:hypothetical protein [Kofleriaceae bacterium]
MTDAQRVAVAAILDEVAVTVAHHGDCVGADGEFHDLARARPGSFIVIHPGPTTDADHAGKTADERREPMNHMKRNKTIVAESNFVIATPFEDVEQEFGGTWKTIGMARKAKRPLAIVMRDGTVTRERWELLACTPA